MPDPQPPTRARLIGHVLIFTGLVVVALGLLWDRLLPAETYWSEQDAAEYAEAFEAAHNASIGRTGDANEPDAAGDATGDNLSEAKRRLAEVEQRLTQARSLRTTRARWYP